MSLQVLAMLVIAAVGVIGQMLVSARRDGGLSATLENHDKKLESLEKSRNDQWGELNDQGNRITSLETWRESMKGRAH